jgi:two-component system, sensor histidine kinase PdtaS
MTSQDLQLANEQLVLRLYQQELIASFAGFTLRAKTLQPVLEEACRIAGWGMRCPFAKVLEFLPEEDTLLMRAGIGRQPGMVGHARLSADEGRPTG